MENHNFESKPHYEWAMINSYVELPEGNRSIISKWQIPWLCQITTEETVKNKEICVSRHDISPCECISISICTYTFTCPLLMYVYYIAICVCLNMSTVCEYFGFGENGCIIYTGK